MSNEIIHDEHEMNMILSVMLKSLLVEKMGEDRVKSGQDNFSFVMPMDSTLTGEKDTFMISYDDQNRFMIERIENDSLPENCIIFFNEDKESAIMNAALHGDGFIIKDEEGPDTEPDPEDHFSGPELP